MLWMALVGCVRIGKLVAAPAVLAEPVVSELVQVQVDAGYPHEEPHLWNPDSVTTRDGQVRMRPESVTPAGSVSLSPKQTGLRLTLWTRSSGLLDRHAFRPVIAVAGGLPGRIENELRFVDTQLAEPMSVDIGDLGNPWNVVRFDHGDLLLIDVSAPDGSHERYLFENRRVGLHMGFSAGVLVRIPLTSDTDVSPILTAGPSFGWRAPSRAPGWRLLDRVAFVTAVGIGSTEIPGDAAALAGVFDAVLVGGGLSLVDVVSVQALANASALLRDANESGWALAVGVDAVGVAALLSGAPEKVARRHALSGR
jgi:hypothetical protein